MSFDSSPGISSIQRSVKIVETTRMTGSGSNQLTRRKLLWHLLGAGACLPFATVLSSLPTADERRPAPARPPVPTALSPEDDQFLDALEQVNFRYFWEQANPETGIIKDRCNIKAPDNGIVGSIAATGFGLTALCIGQQRGFVSQSEARERALATLHSLWSVLPNHRGFFYHWANINTGERIWDAEISSVDTSILLCGVLTCREHFRSLELTKLANDIFNRVDWTWLSEDTSLLPHGWTPEGGFLPYRWDLYSELMMMYLLGLGSASHPLRGRHLVGLETHDVRI